ncbi:hypothetical protein [Erwinia mallotivora]|uniref:hypothetical protein n=1 Tax=Erwinia mallotivora TaxID=69222 RepID=UPI0021C0CDF8|nr:hypothetical protein [Erwinia mallotivora]
MSILTAAQVEADVNYLINGLEVNKRLIPAASTLFKKSSAIPLVTVLLSFLSTVVFYVSSEGNELGIAEFCHFFMTEAWVVVVPSAIIGLFFILFTYNKLMMYFSVPVEVRKKSIILNHLKEITARIVKVFISLMICSVILTPISPWFTFAIPGLLLVLMFATGLIVGAEINRFGTGMALEKISGLLKKI